MKNQNLVSVIIPTYKGDNSLIRAIDSVLNQTYKNFEIIVVDDNDGENEFRKQTKEILEKFVREEKIIYLRHEKNRGLPSARNTGIRKSKGEFVAFLDQDDEWLPTRLEKQLKLFDSLSDDYGVVGSYWRIVNEFDKNERIRKLKYRGDLSKILALNHFSPPSMVIVKRKYLDKVNLFDELITWREDIDLYYRLSFVCKFDFVEEVLVNYYQHPNSMSTNFEKKLSAVIQYLDKHKESIEKNKLPWSEINEHLAELYAVNGNKGKAIKHFGISISNRPMHFATYGKLLYSMILNKEDYKKKRNFK